jgi:nucleotide-binding universal stress UspA family protein
VTLRVGLDAPARAVSTAAADADLVVMGSRGLDAASGQAVGSLSQRLLAETRTPLLVIH